MSENVWNQAEIKRIQLEEIEEGTYNPMPHGMSDEARELARSALYGAMGFLGISYLLDDAVESVAARLEPALRAAEQRGLERAAQQCEENRKTASTRHQAVAHTRDAMAIRALKAAA